MVSKAKRQSSSGDAVSRLRVISEALLWSSLGALVLSVSLREIASFDYWWHLRTGQLILETGSIPKVDFFSYSMPGARYIDIHWLFQVWLYGVYRLAGHAGVVWSQCALTFALCGIIAAIGYRRQRRVITVSALAVMLILIAGRILPRPELHSYILLASILYLLERFRERSDRSDGWVYAIPALQVLWVNIHGLFALGIVLVGFYLAVEIVRWLAKARRADGDTSVEVGRVRRLGAVLFLALLASFCSPNGIDAALYPVWQLGMIGPGRTPLGAFSAELTPTLGSEGAPTFTIAILGVLLIASLVSVAVNRRRVTLSDPLVIFGFLYLALSAERNISIFGIVTAPLLVRNFNEALDARERPRRVGAAVTASVAAVIAVCAAALVFGPYYVRIANRRALGFGFRELMHPVGSVEWIQRNRPGGPIWHSMNDGGYLIWNLYPDYKVLLDGRLEVYGAEGLGAFQAFTSDAFDRIDRRFRFGTALVHYSSKRFHHLVAWMAWNSSWRLVFVDDVAAVFVRVAPGADPLPRAVDLDAPDLFPPISGASRDEGLIRRVARIDFYIAVQRHERALEVWDDVLKDFPELDPGDEFRQLLLEHIRELRGRR
jgi:hypothetical protein